MIRKTAIVTGAAGSLGSQLSSKLVGAGWSVVMLDKNGAGLEQAYDRIDENTTGEAALFPMDLAGADPEIIENLLTTVNAEFGGLDAVVHCAVAFKSLTPHEHIPPDEWLEILQVNLNAPWLLSTMALPMLRNSPAGKLVFVLEDLEKVGNALWGAYGVSKHALRALLGQLATECGKTKVNVRGVNPGPMFSPVRTSVYHSENPADMPAADLPAGKIADYLSGKVDWDTEFVDLSID